MPPTRCTPTTSLCNELANTLAERVRDDGGTVSAFAAALRAARVAAPAGVRTVSGLGSVVATVVAAELLARLHPAGAPLVLAVHLDLLVGGLDAHRGLRANRRFPLGAREFHAARAG
jgi:hypothetical protein